ncbi:MAG TPA: hypothetical protein VMF62_11745 [Acetobacteraceae bacterium]|jgi:hypothetical protein|nr:hypothetical protein [Acetobacteraceae bacterium]
MSGKPAGTVPEPMEGHGAYNRSSGVQAAGLSPALPLFERAARVVPLAQGPEPIVIADYGASEGRNSLAPMRAAIAGLRGRAGRERAISVVHTDQPGNDFAALFEILAGPESYLRGDPAAFAFAIGRSFYGQILPAASVTLGWSSWALQWLSRVPGPIPDHVQIAYSRDEAARTLFARQAAEDWRVFLAHRGHELRPGGQLVLLTMALDEEGVFGYRPLLAAIYAALEEMVADGFLRTDEFGRMVIPTVARSRADLEAPFVPDGRFAGLAIEEIEVFHAEDRLWAEFERNGDAHALGAGWAAFSRASVVPSLASALEGGLEDPRAASFFERMERGMASRVAAAPERFVIPLARMTLARAG